MSIKDTIYTILTNDSDLIALVPATSIGWIDVDENKDYPRIVFKLISAPPLYQSNDQWQRWRFYCYSHLKVECEDIGEALKDLLHGYKGNLVGAQYIDFISKIDEVEVTRQEAVYEKYIDFRISYH